MLKTYLYLPEQLDQKILHTSKVQKKSKAEIIRLALERGINLVSQQNAASAHILRKLADLGKKHNLSGPADSSTKMDELLWAKDWNGNE